MNELFRPGSNAVNYLNRPTQYNSPLFESNKAIEADANAIMTLRAAGKWLNLIEAIKC